MRLAVRPTWRLAATAALVSASYVAYHRWNVTWGATAQEVAEPLPGDDLVDEPWWSATRSITIEAPPADVWPWLVQMGGYTRGGWYSIDRIDNAGRPSASTIIPELQGLAIGDVMPTSPDGAGFRVEAIDPGRSLLLAIREPDASVSAAFVLREAGPNRTRLVTRLQVGGRARLRPLAFTAAMDAGDFVMFRRTLLGIKERAEHRARPDEAAADTGTPPASADHSAPGSVDQIVR